MKVTIIQTDSSHDKDANLATAERLINQAIATDQPDFIALPEMFSFIGGKAGQREAAAEDFNEPSGAFQLLQNLAKKHRIYIHGGSICEKADDKYFNTTPVFSPQGELIATYRKIHLFSAFIEEQIIYEEGAFYSAGDEAVLYPLGDLQVGCSICYDLRFGELYRLLRSAGANIMMAPSAFLTTTGKDHWELLCRTRALETQSFVIAPNQCGDYLINSGERRKNWGHSMIVGPWGNVLAEMGTEEGFVTVALDFTRQKLIRKQLPIEQGRCL